MLEMYSRDSWVRRLVDTRNIIIVPAANALGYAENKREEKGIDPNRDFAWDQQAGQCMRTIAARSINEIWKRHVVQLSITFHGGDHLIAWPWGDMIHCPHPPGSDSCIRKTGEVQDYVTADNSGMTAMVTGMRDYIGTYRNEQGPQRAKYLIGIINDPAVIYAVSGGMEDWAYGASWLPSGKVSCTPQTFGGYSGRTSYNDATHRAINLLVETAFIKAPADTFAGWNDAILGGGGHEHDGHVSRNMRLCLFLTDLVQPWVRFAEAPPANFNAGTTVKVFIDVGGLMILDEAKIECMTPERVAVCEGANET